MKLYVGNLPFTVGEEDLKELFAEFNPVSVKLIVDRDTGRSKGFGFVEFNSKEDGEKAIASRNETPMEGRTIIVNEARPQERRERR